jgi:hypothetical protein
MSNEDLTTQARELHSSISDDKAYFRIPDTQRKEKLLSIWNTIKSKEAHLSQTAKSIFDEITSDDIAGLSNEFFMYEDHVRRKLRESLASQSANTVAPGMMGKRTGGRKRFPRKRTMKKYRKGRLVTQRRKAF